MKNFFVLICTLLTIAMVYQELYTFSIERPTSISTEEGILGLDDLPEVVICSEPGLDLKAVDKYGYLRDTYYRGSHDGKKFVGWNGVKNERPAKDILEEALTIKNTSLLLSGNNVRQGVGFTEDHFTFFTPKISLRTLVFPHGRCISVNPEDPAKFGYNNLLNLYLEFNNSEIDNLIPVDKNLLVLRFYFMDNVNSPRLFPGSIERSNQMEVRLNPSLVKGKSWFNYTTSIEIKTERSHHVQGDHLFDCTEYGKENTYHDCIHNEILAKFEVKLGCAPPLLARSLKTMCNTRFNLTDYEDAKLKQLFRTLLSHVMKFKCKTPCTQRVYLKTVTHQIPYKGTSLIITFNPKVAITKSKFSIDAQTLLTRFGGSVSSGRTLLWILLGFVGASQVRCRQALVKISHFYWLLFPDFDEFWKLMHAVVLYSYKKICQVKESQYFFFF